MEKMKKRRLLKVLLPLVSALLLWPLGASGQTVRGDCNYDGEFNITDLTTLINYLLDNNWNDVPKDLERDTVYVKSEMIVMVHVEGGTLVRDDGGMYAVNSFWICQTEVTRELWAALMGGVPNNQHIAVSNLTWNQCQAFIDTLNAYTGREFRLPSCTEWEFAARGGNRGAGYTYCGGNDLDVVGWYKGNCEKCMPVGLLKCNELGLYDMSGNVSELCQDAANASGTMRYYCGGRYYHTAAENTPSARGSVNVNTTFNGAGCRLAM